jgi:hypothetical protein
MVNAIVWINYVITAWEMKQYREKRWGVYCMRLAFQTFILQYTQANSREVVEVPWTSSSWGIFICCCASSV